MAICVLLIREDGSELASAGADPGLLNKAFDDAEDYRLLRYVDPYGNTIFNSLQMTDFLADWANATAAASKSAFVDQQFAISVEQLAHRCRDEVHLYLKFVGD